MLSMMRRSIDSCARLRASLPWTEDAVELDETDIAEKIGTIAEMLHKRNS